MNIIKTNIAIYHFNFFSKFNNIIDDIVLTHFIYKILFVIVTHGPEALLETGVDA